MVVQCEKCGANFSTKPSRYHRGWGKYCSKACLYNRNGTTLKDRLLLRRKIDPNTGCWHWTGGHATNGYGSIRIGERSTRTHRASAHVYLKMSLDDPRLVCHTCDNPICFNPAHLFIGTDADNTRDRDTKGRTALAPKYPTTKLNPDKVREIRRRNNAGESKASLGREFGTSAAIISYACNGQTWKWIK